MYGMNRSTKCEAKETNLFQMIIGSVDEKSEDQIRDKISEEHATEIARTCANHPMRIAVFE